MGAGDTGDTREQRRDERFFFAIDEQRHVQLSGNTGAALSARVLNLSQGGLGLCCDVRVARALDKSHRLTIDHTKGLDALPALSGAEIEVRWVLTVSAVDQASFGCMFIEPGDALRDQIACHIRDLNQRIEHR